MLVLRLGYCRLSIVYALGPGVVDTQWYDINDADMEGVLMNEECRYRILCTGINLNGINHTVYSLRGVRLYSVEGYLQHGALLFFQHEPLSVLGLRRPGGFLVSC